MIEVDNHGLRSRCPLINDEQRVYISNYVILLANMACLRVCVGGGGSGGGGGGGGGGVCVCV